MNKTQMNKRNNENKNKYNPEYFQTSFFKYIEKHRELSCIVNDDNSFNKMLIEMYKNIIRGGYNRGVYNSFEYSESYPHIAIINIKCFKPVVDIKNKHFVHHFIELYYFYDRQYQNIFDIIVHDSYTDFDKKLPEYINRLSDGLHYIDDEIDCINSIIQINNKPKLT